MSAENTTTYDYTSITKLPQASRNLKARYKTYRHRKLSSVADL